MLYKAKWMGHAMRLELTLAGLLIKLAYHYPVRRTHHIYKNRKKCVLWYIFFYSFVHFICLFLLRRGPIFKKIYFVRIWILWLINPIYRLRWVNCCLNCRPNTIGTFSSKYDRYIFVEIRSVTFSLIYDRYIFVEIRSVHFRRNTIGTFSSKYDRYIFV